MSPACAVLDPRHLLAADAVVDGDQAVQSWVDADGLDLPLGQCGAVVPFTMLIGAASLGGAVPVVVALGPEEQVVDVDARRVVAAMKNTHAVGDRTAFPRPGQAVGLLSSAVDSLTDVSSGATLAYDFDARGHGANPTDGGT